MPSKFLNWKITNWPLQLFKLIENILTSKQTIKWKIASYMTWWHQTVCDERRKWRRARKIGTKWKEIGPNGKNLRGPIFSMENERTTNTSFRLTIGIFEALVRALKGDIYTSTQNFRNIFWKLIDLTFEYNFSFAYLISKCLEANSEEYKIYELFACYTEFTNLYKHRILEY